MTDKAPPRSPIKTKLGYGFRKNDECMDYIRRNNAIMVPEGGLALPLPYAVHGRPTRTVVPSHAVWRGPTRVETANVPREN